MKPLVRVILLGLLVVAAWVATGCNQPLIHAGYGYDHGYGHEPGHGYDLDYGHGHHGQGHGDGPGHGYGERHHMDGTVVPGGGSAQVEPSADGVKTITIRATKYAFDVREIRVKQGDTVEIRLENEKGYHTVKVEGYNLEAKHNRPVAFVATDKGEFAFRCGVMCGSGHSDMTGVLIVE